MKNRKLPVLACVFASFGALAQMPAPLLDDADTGYPGPGGYATRSAVAVHEPGAVSCQTNGTYVAPMWHAIGPTVAHVANQSSWPLVLWIRKLSTCNQPPSSSFSSGNRPPLCREIRPPLNPVVLSCNKEPVVEGGVSLDNCAALLLVCQGTGHPWGKSK